MKRPSTFDHGSVILEISVFRVGCVCVVANVALSPQTFNASVLILQHALGVIFQNHLNRNDLPEKINLSMTVPTNVK